MEYTMKKYAEIIEARRKIEKEIAELEQDEKINKYLILQELDDELYKDQINFCEKMVMNEYKECEHIWVNSKIIENNVMNVPVIRCGCVKCGLDHAVLDSQRGWLSFEDRIKYDYLINNPSSIKKGINTEIECDLSLGQAVYKRIEEKYPQISENEKIRYLKYALYKIGTIKVNDNRSESRAKRLELNRNFHNWQSSDVWGS